MISCHMIMDHSKNQLQYKWILLAISHSTLHSLNKYFIKGFLGAVQKKQKIVSFCCVGRVAPDRLKQWKPFPPSLPSHHLTRIDLLHQIIQTMHCL